VWVDLGATVMGLGGVNAMLGGQVTRLAAQSPVPITTGNTFTTYAAFETVSALMTLPKFDRQLAMIGPPSPVSNALIELFLRRGHHLTILADPVPRPLRSRIEHLNRNRLGTAVFTQNVTAVTGPSKLLVAASSTGGRLKLSECPGGTLVVDVAEPADVVHDSPRRQDILILDGELIRPPNPLNGGLWRSIYGLVTGQGRSIFACFAEPILMARESAPSSLVGRIVSLDALDRLAHRAHMDGFFVDGFHSRGQPVSRERVDRFLMENG
ncbi:MAG: hypothetical protein VX589_01175, partial [Myxococcota bacterium]|nr:hypothetical protein [Myxococcota bacterium]